MSAYTCIHTYAYICIYIYVYVYDICIHVHVHVYVYTYIHTLLYVDTHIHAYTYYKPTYICTYTHQAHVHITQASCQPKLRESDKQFFTMLHDAMSKQIQRSATLGDFDLVKDTYLLFESLKVPCVGHACLTNVCVSNVYVSSLFEVFVLVVMPCVSM